MKVRILQFLCMVSIFLMAASFLLGNSMAEKDCRNQITKMERNAK